MGGSDFEERLYDLWVSRLAHIHPASIAPDEKELRWILNFCDKYHLPRTGFMQPIPEEEQKKFIEKFSIALFAAIRTARY